MYLRSQELSNSIRIRQLIGPLSRVRQTLKILTSFTAVSLVLLGVETNDGAL